MSIEPPLPNQIEVDDEVVLRRVYETSPELMHDLIHRNLDHLGEFLVWAKPDYTLDGVKQFLAATKESSNVSGEQGYSIWYRGELAGAIGVGGFESEVKAVAIGYWLSAHLQGNGIMTRSARAIVELSFAKQGMNHVIIRAAPSNTRSRAIPQRLGFKETGVERQMSLNARGEYLDLITYSLLRSEWEEQSSNL